MGQFPQTAKKYEKTVYTFRIGRFGAFTPQNGNIQNEKHLQKHALDCVKKCAKTSKEKVFIVNIIKISLHHSKIHE